MTRIVFMGTPEFAVPVLEAVAAHHEVVAVYTRADKPAGRGKQLVEAPIKAAAHHLGLPLEQPRSLRNLTEQNHLRSYKPNLIVVAAYGLLLPQTLLDIPTHGAVNLHPSLLPRWRGASPIPFAILSGDTETGVSLMKMDAGLDTGPVLACRVLAVAPDETTGTLTDKLARLGAQLLLESLPAYLAGEISPVPQDNARATMTRLVAKEDGLIRWDTAAVYIERMVRAYNPWPTAYTHYQGEMFKILGASVLERHAPELPGTILQLGRDIGVATGKGVLMLLEVQLAGKRPMTAGEFARGQRDFVGARLA